MQSFQHPNSSYESIFSAYYSIKGIQLLNSKPLHEPSPYILDGMSQYYIDAENVPAEITSIFKRLLYLVYIYKNQDNRNARTEMNISKLVFHLQNDGHGFGYVNSSLDETAKALQILNLIGYEYDKTKITEFLRQSERPDHGFTDVPNTTLSYVEHIYAGLQPLL